MKVPTKEEVLEKYSNRELTRFIQYDVFADERYWDDIVRPDRDEMSLWSSETYELMYGSDVRVFIRPGVSRKKAMLALFKIAAWVERDGVLDGEPDREAAQNMEFEIRSNNCHGDLDKCAICGNETGVDVGPVLVQKGTWNPICGDCHRFVPYSLVKQYIEDRADFKKLVARSICKASPQDLSTFRNVDLGSMPDDIPF